MNDITISFFRDKKIFFNFPKGKKNKNNKIIGSKAAEYQDILKNKTLFLINGGFLIIKTV